ncbi:MAG TPA: hypothetical protein VEA41_02965 [Salinarimonas sp.]|nr:hypothetical protein [Salinarimonas sp.]
MTTVKGKAPRKPPLSHDAKDAIREISMKIGEIERSLEDLSEHSLKGFAYEARRLASAYPHENGRVWAAIADEADHQREIKARHRTGRGQWYACLTLWLHEKPHRTMREIDCIEVLCPTREAAVEALCKLMAENTHRIGLNITADTEIFSEVEHVPRDRDDRPGPVDDQAEDVAL